MSSYLENDKKNVNYKIIRLVVVDVDGTMTDGGIYYDENGNELKKFNTRDAAGYFVAKVAGIKIMVLTGRECYATTRRMQEMKIDYIYQNIVDKYQFLECFLKTEGYSKDEVAYFGDDLNDYYPMSLASVVGCPKDAYDEIKKIATYVSKKEGGKGAVRDFIEHILKMRDEWEISFSKAYGVPMDYISKNGREL